MLGLSDFLNLQVQNAAARILKPWWDIFADYVIRVMLLISVVTGAVTLYMKDIVCIPAITCPVAGASQNPLLQKACAAFYSSNRYHSNFSGLEATVIITKFQDRSLSLYVNAECKRLTVTWFSMFFPFVLFYQAGACLIVHNIWLILSTSTTDQFSTLVQESCDSSDGVPTKIGRRETKAGRQVEELQKVVAEFVSDAWNLAYLQRKVAQLIDGRPGKAGADLQRKVARFAEELKSKSFGCFRIRHVYAMELVFQFACLVIFLSLDLTWERNEGKFKCNIEEFVSGFVLQDHFICSFSHSSFYRWSLVGFIVCMGLHLFVNIRRAVWFFNKGFYCGYFQDGLQQVAPGDFAFLLNLLKTSNPIFLDSINNMLSTPVNTENVDIDTQGKNGIL